MTESIKLEPERDVQLMFTKSNMLSGLSIILPMFAMTLWLRSQPSRVPGPDRVVAGAATPVAVGGASAWRLSAADPRFGGLSALVVDRGALVAMSDSGTVMRFAAPRAGAHPLRMALHDLPGGPGSPLRKSARDSESLLADPAGRGWWVGFEHRHSLWLFDRALKHVLERRRLNVDWPTNRGAEALVAAANGMVMALPELGGRAAGGTIVAPPWTSDATRLPDGRLVVLQRRPTLAGLVNSVSIGAGAGKPARHIRLALAPLDNMEGVAAEARADGRIRLWIVSDDNFRPWMRTLLVALDLPAGT